MGSEQLNTDIERLASLETEVRYLSKSIDSASKMLEVLPSVVSQNNFLMSEFSAIKKLLSEEIDIVKTRIGEVEKVYIKNVGRGELIDFVLRNYKFFLTVAGALYIMSSQERMTALINILW